ncbi:helix-turn-helix transcriptional regulator [Leptolyngbya sp. FACHB-321]|uniref:helix-turn-helix transcriptional regulator n=1 Tax=Leptolyngbya sp. FACHB-321 TaxID=2692807 RepID=UPI0016824F4F|nr:AraC family transcriptional regulator [Leptolyngbya sp. FACHB-321]MBD2036149.1 helix-turn-helix transcriptional regulator [Leptolyngbya sp. FACHB-321]
MLKTKTVTENLPKVIELGQRFDHTTPVLSSRQRGWNGIVVEQYQHLSNSFEVEFPAPSDHWLVLPLGQPVLVTQKSDDRLHESIIQRGDTILVPAGQPKYWCRREGICCAVHMHLKPEMIRQTAEASEMDTKRTGLVDCSGKQDLQLHQIAMLLLAELESGGMMGQLYVESLTQVLAIHLLRHYSTVTQTITSENRSLNHIQLQQTIDYIHTYLNRDLSLAELASVINISPTYFASLFKQAMGISPHQYVIQQRVEQAKVMLKRTNLTIADIALQVGFSNQSHLTRHFKRFTGMTPKQIR